MDKPVWLDEETWIKELLHYFVVQTDGKKRAYRRVNKKNFPDLYNYENQDNDYLWSLVCALSEEFGVLSIELEAKRKSYDDPWENAKLRFNKESVELVKTWLRLNKEDQFKISWEEQLAVFSDRLEFPAALECCEVYRKEGRTAAQIISGFVQASQLLQTAQLTQRELSAKCFQSDSKFLDRHESVFRSLNPNQINSIVPRRLLISVQLPEKELARILFVENRESFLRVCELGLPGVAVIYSAGFYGSAERIRKRENVVFTFLNLAVNPVVKSDFDSYWFGEGEMDAITHFWGDLDYSALGILKSLKKTFDTLTAWEKGYSEMVTCLTQGGGHSAEMAGKSGQVDPVETGCPYSDQVLLPLIRKTGRFIDQEAFNFR